MPASFSLRIESGAQAGEIATLEGGGLSVGRRPGNDLVLQDPSVSGRHARLSIESDSLVVVDFGSTNGTFVGGEKVDEATLAPGARLRFGKVELSVHAGALEASAPADELTIEESPAAMPAAAPPPRTPAPAPRASAEPPAAPIATPTGGEPGDDLELELEDPAGPTSGIDDDQDDELHDIDLARLAKAKQGPGALPLIALVAVLGGGAAWYFMGMPGLGGGGEEAGPARPVPTFAGNLLADPSFEAGDLAGPAWTVDETAPVSPWTSTAWREGGDLGVGCDLEDGDWGLVRSAPARIPTIGGLVAAGVAWAEGAGRVSLGIELIDEEGAHPPVVAWTAPVGEHTEGDGDGELVLELATPPGYESARVLLRSWAEGGVGAGAFDDLRLVKVPLGSTSGSTSAIEGFSLHDLGRGRTSLAHIDRPLVLSAGRTSGTSVASRVEGDNFALEFGGAGALELVLDPGFLAQGLATLGEGGYRPHGDAFEDEGVTSIVVGDGVHQLRLVLPAATTVSGQPLVAGFRLTCAELGGELLVEQGFAEERARAGRLDDKARMAEREGDLAGALGLWGQLLDQVPFDAELVLAAEAGRGRLIAAGLAELDELEADFERARFFGLPDLFQQCLDGIDAVALRYAGSEVEDLARAQHAELAAEVAALAGGDSDALAGARSEVLDLIESEGAAELAAHLRAAQGASDNGEND